MPGQVDLTNCDREPIHLLGGVQPFAFLLALSSDWIVARASANLEAHIGMTAEDAIGQPLLSVLDADAVHAIRNRLTTLRGADGSERIYGLRLKPGGPRFDVAVHMSGAQVVVEGEPAQSDASDSAGMVRAMMARLDDTPDFAGFFREASRQVRALTGFDRVMVYRFDAEGAGEVVAEAARSGIGSFMGLRYPASDIPAQARILYLRNIFRVIADVAAPAVPIVPMLDERDQPIDLSLAIARSVSPIHLEYLANMGVAASLSISIVVEGRLWGLFACHHYAPRLPALERRALSELFGQMFAMKLESRERRAAVEFASEAKAVSDRILAAVAGDAGLLDNPTWLAEMLQVVIPSDGVGVAINGRLATSGLAPDDAEFARLTRALNRTAAGRVYATDRIQSLAPDGESYADRAAGMLALPISRSPRDYVVLFRQEAVRTVKWGGDPYKPVTYGANGPRLSPRQSFETWSETVRGRSMPFTTAEVAVAETLRATLIEVVLRLSDDAHAERQRAEERQALLIAELNHRVRNILSLIRGLVRQSVGNASTIGDYVREVDGRIHALARAHNQITAEHWGPGPLRPLIETEAAAYLAGKSDRVQCTGPDVLLHPQAYSTMALVLHELVTNSAKYGGLSDSGRVDVSWEVDDDGDLRLRWREIGGPPVKAPTRSGFGSTIIQRSIPYDLGGAAEIRFALTGLEADFCLPARHIAQRSATPAAPAHRPLNGDQGEAVPIVHAADEKPLAGLTVLLVEDSLIIAMDAEDILVSLGADRVLPASNARAALSEIDRERPDLALLDINLGEQTSLPVAERLQEIGVPIVFATGYGDQAQLPDALADVQVVQKPYSRDGVLAALDAMGWRAAG